MDDNKALKIITLTSWKKRLCNIPKVLDSIYKQTIPCDKVVLNLSIEEFPEKEKNIPENVLKYIKEHGVEIYWVPGPNTKQWKKIIPTLQRYSNDWVICIDDDRLYGNKFIENLWNKHLRYPNTPITVNKGYSVKGFLQHCGHGTLECMDFYNNFDGIDINEVMKKTSSSDTFFNYVLAKNGYMLLPIDVADTSSNFNEVDPLSKTNATKEPRKHLELWNWLCEKYGKVIKFKGNAWKPDDTYTDETPNTLCGGIYGITEIKQSNKSKIIKRGVVRKFR